MEFDFNNLRRVKETLQKNVFEPHPTFRGNHAQTLIGYLAPRRFSLRRALRDDEKRVFEIEPDVKLLARCHWQSGEKRRNAATLILVHGLEGSSESVYLLGTAAKAVRAGFNVVRLNLRTCGETEHLSAKPYNASLSNDILAVVNELIERDKLTKIFLAGFSLGGNICLKYAGETGENAPAEVCGVAAVSPSIDLSVCANAISRPENWIYQQRFVSGLKRRVRKIKQLYPQDYDLENLRRVRTVRDFDQHFTSVYGGFAGVEDYYNRASALQFIEKICVPTLIVHAQDDPFVPFESFQNRALSENPFVILLAPARGGHVGFVSADRKNRFWAESKIVEFCSLITAETRA